jgi:hypothetical protein
MRRDQRIHIGEPQLDQRRPTFGLIARHPPSDTLLPRPSYPGDFAESQKVF